HVDVGDVDVPAAVPVDVAEVDVHAGAAVAGPGHLGEVGEGAVAVVLVEGVRPEVVGDEDVRIAVGVVVGGPDRQRPAGIGHRGGGANLGVAAVAAAPPELVG